jgi:endonuclease/exonuclease/phosphatase family metal-dependent hydrolase
MPSLATFNANNFFLRYKFSKIYPGDMSRNSLIEATEVIGGPIGYLPGLAFQKYTKNFIIWDPARRQLAVKALMEPDQKLPDILCFQEVENIHAIRLFNQKYLNNNYKYSLLIDSYDDRNIDVGILSVFPIRQIKSHIDDKDGHKRIFSRDCLEVEVELDEGSILTLFLNHLKSKLVIREKNETNTQYNARVLESHQKREKQAKEVIKFVKQRFHGQHDTALYAVIGDFNDTPESPWVKLLVESDLVTNIIEKYRPKDDCWTYYWRSKNRVSQIDYVLTSEALTKRIGTLVSTDSTKKPHIERKGIAYREKNAKDQILPKQSNLIHFEQDAVTTPPAAFTPSSKVDFRFTRYQEVMDNWKNNISDHCPVKIWF